jgi:hypothetical protein
LLSYHSVIPLEIPAEKQKIASENHNATMFVGAVQIVDRRLVGS